MIVEERDCWVCGGDGRFVTITKHHVIPKHLDPKKNVLVPVCQACHDKINEADYKGIRDFSYKIMKLSQEHLKVTQKLVETTAQVHERVSKETDEKIKARLKTLGPKSGWMQFEKGYAQALHDMLGEDI